MIYEGPLRVLDFEEQMQISRNLREGATSNGDEGFFW